MECFKKVIFYSLFILVNGFLYAPPYHMNRKWNVEELRKLRRVQLGRTAVRWADENQEATFEVDPETDDEVGIFKEKETVPLKDVNEHNRNPKRSLTHRNKLKIVSPRVDKEASAKALHEAYERAQGDKESLEKFIMRLPVPQGDLDSALEIAEALLEEEGGKK